MTQTTLRRMSPDLLDAEEQGIEAFAATFGCPSPFAWPPEFHDRKTRNHLRGLQDVSPENAVFVSYYMVADGRPVGSCGFKGAPDDEGRVDIGYSVEPGERRKGHASAAVRQLLDLAFADPRVTHVVAETIPALIASQRTAESCGFVLTNQRPDQDLGEILIYTCARRGMA